MIGIAALWISVLLLGGGVALDRVLSDAVTRNFDDGMNYVLTAMIAAAEIGPDGEVLFNRELADQRFLEPNSGLYYQISAKGHEDWRSRSLWDRALKVPGDHADRNFHVYDSKQFPGEDLRAGCSWWHRPARVSMARSRRCDPPCSRASRCWRWA